MVTKEQAIKMYIKDNFIAHRCSVCRTATEVGFDDLSGESFCTPCLVKELQNDEQALIDYIEGDNGE